MYILITVHFNNVSFYMKVGFLSICNCSDLCHQCFRVYAVKIPMTVVRKTPKYFIIFDATVNVIL